MSDIQIILDPPQPIYLPGYNLTGYVLLNLSKERKANKISLEAKGRAHVIFWHGHDDDRHSYSNDKVYLDHKLILWQKNEAKGEIMLPMGIRKYPFSITLPYDAPPSLEGNYGNIRYMLKARLDLPWAFDKTSEVGFQVGTSIDPNSSPIYIQPQYGYINKTGLFSSSSSVNATISIPRLAWGPDENIPIHCNITNNSSDEITSIEFTIIKNATFTGRTGIGYHRSMTRQQNEKLNPMKTNVSIPISATRQVEVHIPVPGNLTTVVNCPFINISYELEVKLHDDNFFSFAPSTRIPIVISNVRLVPLLPVPQAPTIGNQLTTNVLSSYSSMGSTTEQNSILPPVPILPFASQSYSAPYPNHPSPYPLPPMAGFSNAISNIPPSYDSPSVYPSAPPMNDETMFLQNKNI